jgi:hypothetical protein
MRIGGLLAIRRSDKEACKLCRLHFRLMAAQAILKNLE